MGESEVCISPCRSDVEYVSKKDNAPRAKQYIVLESSGCAKAFVPQVTAVKHIRDFVFAELGGAKEAPLIDTLYVQHRVFRKVSWSHGLSCFSTDQIHRPVEVSVAMQFGTSMEKTLPASQRRSVQIGGLTRNPPTSAKRRMARSSVLLLSPFALVISWRSASLPILCTRETKAKNST